MKNKVAVLFGFMYRNSPNNEILPGVIIDLYHNYKYLQNLDYDKILVITDIFDDIDKRELRFAIIKGNVSTEICTFINYLKTQELIYFYENIDNLIIKLNDFLNEAKLIYLYYSGHAINNNLVFPDTTYNTNNFIKLILNKIQEISQILFIFDCCHGSNFGLPCYLNNSGEFKLNNINEPFFTKHNIISIMATESYEKSYATVFGSPFTNSIIENLKSDKLTSWIDLNIKLQEKLDAILNNLLTDKYKPSQTVKIYSSKINDDLWYWINHKYSGILSWNYQNNFLCLN